MKTIMDRMPRTFDLPSLQKKLGEWQTPTKPPGFLQTLTFTLEKNPPKNLGKKGVRILKALSTASKETLQQAADVIAYPVRESAEVAGKTAASIAVAAPFTGLAVAILTKTPELMDEVKTVGLLSAAAMTTIAAAPILGGLAGANQMPWERNAKERDTNRWRIWAKLVPNQHLEEFLTGATPHQRGAVMKDRAQEILGKTANLPPEKLQGYLAKQPRFYGKTPLEILFVSEEMDPTKIGPHKFPKDFLNALPNNEKAALLADRLTERIESNIRSEDYHPDIEFHAVAEWMKLAKGNDRAKAALDKKLKTLNVDPDGQYVDLAKSIRETIQKILEVLSRPREGPERPSLG